MTFEDMCDVTLVDVPDLHDSVCGPGCEICGRGINLTHVNRGLVCSRDNAIRVNNILGMGCGECEGSKGE